MKRKLRITILCVLTLLLGACNQENNANSYKSVGAADKYAATKWNEHLDIHYPHLKKIGERGVLSDEEMKGIMNSTPSDKEMRTLMKQKLREFRNEYYGRH